MATKLSQVGSQVQVNLNAFNAQLSPDIVPLTDGRFVAVYQSTFNPGLGDIDILGRFVTANGTPSGTTISVATNTGRQVDPAVAARSDGGFITIWQDFGTTNGAPDPIPDIYYSIVNSAGINIMSRTLLMDTTIPLEDPDIASMSDGRQIIVADGDLGITHNIYFDVLSADGTTQLFAAGGIGIADGSNGPQQNPSIAAGGPNQALMV
jgi:hypothetical protein